MGEGDKSGEVPVDKNEYSKSDRDLCGTGGLLHKQEKGTLEGSMPMATCLFSAVLPCPRTPGCAGTPLDSHNCMFSGCLV